MDDSQEPVKVLIVDDEFAFAEIAELILSRAGYWVSKTDNGSKALEMIKEDPPDLVLTDVEMPEMDGFELLRRIRESPELRVLPVILMSSRRSYPHDRVEGLNLGGDDFLTKPFAGNELMARVQAVLRRAGMTKAMPAAVAAPPSPAPAQAPPSLIELLEMRIKEVQPFAALYVDLNGFRHYNQKYGFEKGDEVIQMTHDILSQAVQEASGGEDVVKHLGGDDFMILTIPERALAIARNAVHAFDTDVLEHYAPADREAGFIQIKDRMNRSFSRPLLGIVVAIVSNQKRQIRHLGEAAHIGMELLAFAKTLGGSRYVQDRRSSGRASGKES